MVYHGFWLVSMVLLVENTTKLYPGPTIQCRPSLSKQSVAKQSSKDLNKLCKTL